MISKDSVVIKQYSNSQKINFSKELSDILRGLEKEIVEINQGQMLTGKTGLGNIRQPHSDLYESGEFQGAMFMNVSNDKVLINSSDWKRDVLVEYQGEDIFDLNSENLSIAQDLVTPIYNKRIHTLLNK